VRSALRGRRLNARSLGCVAGLADALNGSLTTAQAVDHDEKTLTAAEGDGPVVDRQSRKNTLAWKRATKKVLGIIGPAGLQPGQQLHLRVAVQRKDDLSDWSDELAIVVR
jgi:hypothetical protein